MLFTVKQLAERWNVTKEYLDKLRSKNDGPKWINISRKGAKRATVRYSIEAIEKYEKEHLHKSSSQKPKGTKK